MDQTRPIPRDVYPQGIEAYHTDFTWDWQPHEVSSHRSWIGPALVVTGAMLILVGLAGFFG